MGAKELNVQNPTITDLLNLAEFKEHQAQKMLEEGRKSDYASLVHQKDELHAIAHAIAQVATYNTTGIEISKLREKFNSALTMNADILSKQSKQLKLNLETYGGIAEIPEATVTESAEESREDSEKILDDIPKKFAKFNTDSRDIQAQILTRKLKKNKEENFLVNSLRSTICRLIAEGERKAAAEMADKYVIQWNDYKNLSQKERNKISHDFVTAVKEQFQIPEPAKNPRKKSESPPGGKWVYAVYNVRLSDKTVERKGFILRRKGSDNIDFINSLGEFACHTVDVKKWREATKKEANELDKNLPTF